jgi:hypothetical protein
MKQQALKVIAVYDNNGASLDRYTVYYNAIEKRVPQNGSGTCKGAAKQRYNNFYMCLGMNAAPFHPQGIGMHSSGMLGRHNGKRIRLEDLPEDCQQAVRNDLSSPD